uniref:Uncharacterized protein n=1 Tax=Arundo donax TaxID=35708 RepID=A0A0A9EUS9_ARUDO
MSHAAATFLLLVTLAGAIVPPLEVSAAGAVDVEVLLSFFASLPRASRRILRPLWKENATAIACFLASRALPPAPWPPSTSPVRVSPAHSQRPRRGFARRLCALPALATLDLSHNHFTCPVPVACSGVAALLLGGEIPAAAAAGSPAVRARLPQPLLQPARRGAAVEPQQLWPRRAAFVGGNARAAPCLTETSASATTTFEGTWTTRSLSSTALTQLLFV